jgi:hypothetical protein
MIGYVYPTGRVTRHEIRGLPAPSPEELVELLEKDLASSIDDDELPSSPEGWALGWVGVELADSWRQLIDARRVCLSDEAPEMDGPPR